MKMKMKMTEEEEEKSGRSERDEMSVFPS